MSQRDTFTRWGVISSGEGGGRIAAQLLAREDNPGIDDRIALLNTNRADILNTIERASLEDTSEFTTVFGSKRGVGNNFIAGEQCAREDLDLIVGDIQERMTGADAFMHMTTLGGGTGYLSPKHGFTADNLREIDVVTGRGERVTANAERNADLFWAARGGGTPGVVTAFEFDLHPLDHEVRYFESWLPLDTAADALRAYRRYQRTAPDEACVSPYFAAVPETDDFPVERHGEVAVVLSGVYTGDPSEADATVDAFTARPASFAESVETMPYTVLQSMMDDDFPDGRRYYWKSVPLASFDDDAIRALESAAARMPSALSTIVVWPMHGAVARGSGADGPIAGRDADVVINVEAAWDGPMATTEHVEWVRETCRRFRALDATSGTLPNFAGGSDPDAEAVYADEADRLRAVRRTYDPDGVFAYERV